MPGNSGRPGARGELWRLGVWVELTLTTAGSFCLNSLRKSGRGCDSAGRAGVAAPQIGVGLRAFSYNIDGEIGYILNPVLAEVRGEPVPVGEGCLSVPGLWHDALRHPWARVTGVDLDGNEVVLEGEGLMAQALQHETDHLDGMLYLSRLAPDDRKRAMREVRESAWF